MCPVFIRWGLLITSQPKHYDVIIVGAGPGGLACGAKLAANGYSTLIVERKKTIGPKSCAGGITWSGLIGQTPAELIERSFSVQYVASRFQRIRVTADNPIIATVDRHNLGQCMAKKAHANGAVIRTAVVVEKIDKKTIQIRDLLSKKRTAITYSYLIGADGSSSCVRRFLAIPTERMGIGINFQITGHYDRMEWHLNSRFFDNGYGWIFPHHDTISIGAYTPQPDSSAAELKTQLISWAQQADIELSDKKCTAGYINYDYRGHDFGKAFLVGDAAGLASALTGEGIYPAILSGIAVAEIISKNRATSATMTGLLKQHDRFVKMVSVTGKNNLISTLMAEIGVLGLRLNLINFNMLEMSN